MTHSRLARDLFATFVSQWRVMVAVLPGVVLALMQSTALDLPMANVVDALDSDHYRMQWIMGAYVLGGALGMAFTSFCGRRLGLKRAYMAGLMLFSTASGLAGVAQDVVAMTPCRFAQGFGMGLTIASAMVLIWRAFPIHKELAMAIYGMAIYLPSILGASLGGLATEGLSWRLIFLANPPLGALLLIVAWRCLPYETVEGTGGARFDWIGVALLAASVVTINVVLDMGQYWGWFSSRFFAPWFVAALAAWAAFFIWGFSAPRPLINLRTLSMRRFGLGLGIKVAYSINLYVVLSLLANYMINLRGYQWWQGALVILAALFTMMAALLLGVRIGTDRNRRFRMFAGLAIMALATWQLGAVDVYTAKTLQAMLLAGWGVGAGLVCGPALLTTFEGMSNEQTLDTAGVFNIARSLPAFVVGALLVTLLARHTDENFDWLRQNIRHNRPIVADALRDGTAHMVAQGSPHTVATKQADAMLGKWVEANAHAYAFQDAFRWLALAPCVGLFFVLVVPIGQAAPMRDE
ncbi:MAG: MFS transporter [Pirellulales bacterium]|nr:MFS transporter [Pirellulales bacterium]